MYVIIYNPKSKGAKEKKILANVLKCIKDTPYIIKSVYEINNIVEFISSLKEDEYPLIVGGDGTMHYIINMMAFYNVKKDIYAYMSGTGNDFSRNVNCFKKIIKLNDYFDNLPSYIFNEKEYKFLNGVGIGVDALVCKYVSTSKGRNAFTYTKKTFKALFNYKPKPMKVIIDDKEFNYDKCWLISCNNGECQGGGMKFAPNKKINDGEIGVVVIHSCPKFLLLILFLSIYKGNHLKYKKYVSYLKGKNIKLIPSTKVYLQADGEVFEDFNFVDIKVK